MTGPFAKTGTAAKKQAKEFIDSAKNGGQLNLAAEPGKSAKTTKSNGAFHLDRQQRPNADGQRKVAVQLNKVKKGDPSTIAQVAIHGGAKPGGNRVAKKLSRSLMSEKETHINHPGSKEGRDTARQASGKKGKK